MYKSRSNFLAAVIWYFICAWKHADKYFLHVWLVYMSWQCLSTDISFLSFPKSQLCSWSRGCWVAILQRSNARVIAIPSCKTNSRQTMPLQSRCLMWDRVVNMMVFYVRSAHLRLWNFHAGNYASRLTALLILLLLFMWKIFLSARYYCRYPWLGLNHSRHNSDLSPFQPCVQFWVEMSESNSKQSA